MWNNRMGTAGLEKKLDKILLILDNQEQERTATVEKLLDFCRSLGEQQDALSEKLDKLLGEVEQQKKEREILRNDFKALLKSKMDELLESEQNLGKHQDAVSKQLADSIESLARDQTSQLLKADQSLANQLSQLLKKQEVASTQTGMIEELIRLLVANKYLDNIQIPNAKNPSSKSIQVAPKGKNSTNLCYALYFEPDYAPNVYGMEKDNVVLCIVQSVLQLSSETKDKLQKLASQQQLGTYKDALQSFPTYQEAERVKLLLSNYGVNVQIK